MAAKLRYYEAQIAFIEKKTQQRDKLSEQLEEMMAMMKLVTTDRQREEMMAMMKLVTTDRQREGSNKRERPSPSWMPDDPPVAPVHLGTNVKIVDWTGALTDH